MSAIDPTVNRNSFFPKSKGTATSTTKSRALKGGYIKGNSPERKQELDQMSQRDAKVNINNAVKDFAKIKSAVDKAPEIDNSAKIAALKQQIQAGTYSIDYDALADKMLESEF